MLTAGSDVHVDPLPDGWARRVMSQARALANRNEGSGPLLQLLHRPVLRELVFRECYNYQPQDLEDLFISSITRLEAGIIQATGDVVPGGCTACRQGKNSFLRLYGVGHLR